MEQLSMFPRFVVDKPIRLIELFGGYGSQSLALKYLGIPFEQWRLSEWAIKSIQAYKDLHNGNDNTDYSANLSDSEVKDFLRGKISSDYSTPLTDTQINRIPGRTARTIYNNMQATHNLGSITTIHGNDLAITDTDKYCYIMTYSFPCQDLSNAGLKKGMAIGGGTRSGLLWEVARLLQETDNLPQVLLMENVPQVLGKKNINDFTMWVEILAKLGYQSKYELLNAKDFAIPQNRNRCYMVSVLGGGEYGFPETIGLDYRLKDFLDKNVDEKYYLSNDVVIQLNEHKERQQRLGNTFGWKPTTGGGTAQTIKTESGYRPGSNFIIERTRDND